MNDPEIEDLLRRYQPAGPPADFRSRIVASARVQRIWPWATAAAVLLISMLTMRIVTRSAAADIDPNFGPSAIDRTVSDVTQMLGDTPETRALAESIVVEEQLREQDWSRFEMLDEVNGERR